jgi:hypothetical protein
MSRFRFSSAVLAAVLVLAARAHVDAVGTDVPLTSPPFATFGPGHLDVVIAGQGIYTQPASFSVDVPATASIEAAYLYVTGRGGPDNDILLNGNPLAVPLVATAGPLPFDTNQSTYTQRANVSALVAPGTTNFTVSGYTPATPGGAIVVVVYRDAGAPVQTIILTEGADYGYHGFAPPFGPNTDVGRIDFAPSADPRAATFYLLTHDSQPDGGDAVWFLAAASGTTPVPASLVGGVSGAVALEIDLPASWCRRADSARAPSSTSSRRRSRSPPTPTTPRSRSGRRRIAARARPRATA